MFEIKLVLKLITISDWTRMNDDTLWYDNELIHYAATFVASTLGLFLTSFTRACKSNYVTKYFVSLKMLRITMTVFYILNLHSDSVLKITEI